MRTQCAVGWVAHPSLLNKVMESFALAREPPLVDLLPRASSRPCNLLRRLPQLHVIEQLIGADASQWSTSVRPPVNTAPTVARPPPCTVLCVGVARRRARIGSAVHSALHASGMERTIALVGLQNGACSKLMQERRAFLAVDARLPHLIVAPWLASFTGSHQMVPRRVSLSGACKLVLQVADRAQFALPGSSVPPSRIGANFSCPTSRNFAQPRLVVRPLLLTSCVPRFAGMPSCMDLLHAHAELLCAHIARSSCAAVQSSVACRSMSFVPRRS